MIQTRAAIWSIVLGCAVAFTSAAADRAQSLQFTSEDVVVNASGEIVSARNAEFPMNGATLRSSEGHFVVQGETGQPDYSMVRLSGKSTVVTSDGTEIEFSSGATLDRSRSRVTLDESGEAVVREPDAPREKK